MPRLPRPGGISLPRRAIELAGRRRSFWRRLPDEFGRQRFRASTEGGLKYLRTRTADIDPDLLHFARGHVRSGDVVWDIGANLGLFSLAAAAQAGSQGAVVAVEPDSWLVSQLLRGTERSGFAPVEVLGAAVSSHVSIAALNVAQRARACNYLDGGGSSQAGGVRLRVNVPVTTLDAMLAHFDAPNVVKIDVEGLEQHVLEGGKQLLAEHQPVILVEVRPEHAHAVGALLGTAGYTLSSWPDGTPTDLPTWNTLAVPQR